MRRTLRLFLWTLCVALGMSSLGFGILSITGCKPGRIWTFCPGYAGVHTIKIGVRDRTIFAGMMGPAPPGTSRWLHEKWSIFGYEYGGAEASNRIITECGSISRGVTTGVRLPTWAICVLSSIPPLVLLIRHGFRRRSRGKGFCETCGYNLTGNVSGVCPECGHAVPQGETADEPNQPRPVDDPFDS